MHSEKSKQRKELASLLSRGWVSLRQFAKIIGVSYPTAQRMKNNGDVKVVKVGGVHRVYSDEVKRFLRDGNANNGDGEGASGSPPLLTQE